MSDKFILTNLSDENSKYIADALKSKTCKKILNFLAETKEASEKDISKALNLPLNTIEYNLKKLIKSRLVEKTKNFFWSVKGRKINMYKLAEKHIIISPHKNLSLDFLKKILPITLITGFFGILIKYLLQSFISINQFTKETSALKSTSSESSPSFFSGFFTKLISMPYWAWFLIGIIIGLVIMLIYNYRKSKHKKDS